MFLKIKKTNDAFPTFTHAIISLRKEYGFEGNIEFEEIAKLDDMDKLVDFLNNNGFETVFVDTL